MATTEPTYEELRAQRQEEWRAAQAIVRKNLADLHAALAEMPDIRLAPSPDLPWSHEAISCLGCAGKSFSVKRWVSVNGVRYRAELKCLEATCGRVGTWDWTTIAWCP